MINWDKIEFDIEDGKYTMTTDNGPGLEWQYQGIKSLSLCGDGNFIGVFTHGMPIHTRIPYEWILKSAEAIKREILFRRFK